MLLLFIKIFLGGEYSHSARVSLCSTSNDKVVQTHKSGVHCNATYGRVRVSATAIRGGCVTQKGADLCSEKRLRVETHPSKPSDLTRYVANPADRSIFSGSVESSSDSVSA